MPCRSTCLLCCADTPAPQPQCMSPHERPFALLFQQSSELLRLGDALPRLKKLARATRVRARGNSLKPASRPPTNDRIEKRRIHKCCSQGALPLPAQTSHRPGIESTCSEELASGCWKAESIERYREHCNLKRIPLRGGTNKFNGCPAWMACPKRKAERDTSSGDMGRPHSSERRDAHHQLQETTGLQRKDSYTRGSATPCSA